MEGLTAPARAMELLKEAIEGILKAILDVLIGSVAIEYLAIEERKEEEEGRKKEKKSKRQMAVEEICSLADENYD